jgi:hypothetical protein
MKRIENPIYPLLCLLLVFLTTNLSATTYYVTPAGAGVMNGTSWNDAAPWQDLQTMVDSALAGDEVWVACGEYFTTATTNRSISFHMRNEIAIYGSFLGTETLLSQRALTCGPCSILSGEIGAAGNADNSFTVVRNENLDSTAILDGFHLRGANDDRNPTSNGNGLGGGMYNHGYGAAGFCNPVIRNCLFTDNSASWGGGAFNNGYADGFTEPTYINCIFANNHGYQEAGGMDTYAVGGHGSPTLYNCLFYGNTSASNVGAMYAWGGNNGNCTPTLYNCAFVNNSAQNGYGGALIADNQDEVGQTSSGNCVVTLVNCILWNNTATGAAPQFYVRGTNAEVRATYSCIDMTGQSGQNVVSGPATGNISTNPMFMDLANAIGLDGCWMTNDDGIRLNPLSPAIDAGNSAGVTATDLGGNARVVGSSVDMGPYEDQGIVAVEFATENEVFQIGPNPVSTSLRVKGSPEIMNGLQVYNLRGQLLNLRRLNSASTELDVSDLEVGIYFARSGNQCRKFIISR